jgi:hypothetical protein
MAATYTIPTQGTYNNTFTSTFDFVEKPQIAMELYQKWGKGITMVQQLRNMAAEFSFSNDYFEAHEEGVEYNTITVKTIASATISTVDYAAIELSDDDLNGTDYLPRVNETVLYQHTNDKVYRLQIVSITAAAGADNPKLNTIPFAADTELSVADVVAGITIGDVLALGGTTYAPGTGMPAGRRSGLFQFLFYPFITKETVKFIGGELIKEKWYDVQAGGYNSPWSRALVKHDLNHDIAEEINWLFGQDNDRSLTQSDEDGNSQNIHAGDGMWTRLVDYGGNLPYGTGDFTYAKLDTAATYLESQGVTGGLIAFYVAPDLARRIDRGMVDYISNVSLGTDLSTKIMERGYAGFAPEADLRSVGINIKQINYGSYTFVIIPLEGWANPKLIGASSMSLNKSGFMCPLGDSVKNYKTNEYMPNIGIGHTAKYGVNRKRVFKVLNGINGFEVNGAPSVNEYDTIKGHTMSERLFFGMELNKWMYVTPTNS